MSAKDQEFKKKNFGLAWKIYEIKINRSRFNKTVLSEKVEITKIKKERSG